MSQNPTPDWSDVMSPEEPQDSDNPDGFGRFRTISPPQFIVIQHLLAGDSVTVAAKKANVGRSTVYDWLHDDRDFQDAYFTARADLLAAAQNRLLNMTHSALDSLAAGLSNRRNPWLGYAVLRRLGALSEIHSFDVGGVPTNFLMDLIPPVKHRTILFRPPWGGDRPVPPVDPLAPPNPL